MCDEITKKVAYITTKSTTEEYFEYNQILQKVDEAIRKFGIDTDELNASNELINSESINKIIKQEVVQNLV